MQFLEHGYEGRMPWLTPADTPSSGSPGSAPAAPRHDGDTLEYWRIGLQTADLYRCRLAPGAVAVSCVSARELADADVDPIQRATTALASTDLYQRKYAYD